MHIKAVLTNLASMSTQTPAGWYPDPYGEPQLRWWDGDQWTDAVHAQQPGSAPQPQQPGSGPQPQPQSSPDWSATPANPTLQYGQPTFGQPAYGPPGASGQQGPSSPQGPSPQWGGPGGPGQGFGAPPPPKQGNPLPWVFGGLAALVVIALIVVGGIFVVNRSGSGAAAQPTDTYEEQQPPGNDPPTDQPPGQSTFKPPQPVDGRLTDARAGVSFEVPDGWTVPPPGDMYGSSPVQQLWSGGVQATAQENYNGQGDWIGNVYTGVLSELYPYAGASGLGDTAKTVFVDFSTKYYQLTHTTKVVQDKAMKLGDKDAWVLQFELDFSKVSEEKGYKWKKENGAVVLIDRGEGQRPAIVYASVPDNLGTDVLSKVLSSLKPA